MEATKKKQPAAYTALYRRWRPQLFSEVVGQNHVTRTLQNALSHDRVAHAYLFCGLRGTGKTTMAKLLGKALNCLAGVNPEPCNRCRSCREVMEGRNMDVLEIDAASNRGIDEIRDLREKTRYVAAQNRYKVYIIDEVHMLTNEAFNALLKTLEEPPPGVVFILATTEAHKLPLTVISRCQRFDFHLLEAEQIVGRLHEVSAEINFAVEEETLFLLARQADGSIRDALGFLEQCKAYGGEKVSYNEALEIMGLTSPEVIFRLLQAVIGENIGEGLAVIKEIIYRGRDLHRFLKELILYLRKLLLLQAGGEQEKILADVSAFRPYLLQHKEEFGHHVLLEMLEILQQFTYQLRGASQPHFLLELTFLRLLRVYRFRHYLSPGDFFSRLVELEHKLQSLEKSNLNMGIREATAAPAPESPEEERQEIGTGQEKGPAALPATIPGESAAPAKETVKKAAGKDPGPDKLFQFWENHLLPAVKKLRKSNIYALLQMSRPVSCQGGIFTIALAPSQQILKARMEASGNKDFIESLLHQLWGEKLSLQVVLQEEKEKNEAEKILEKKKLLERKKDEIKSSRDFFIGQMLELFNGRLIKTRNEPLDPQDFWSLTQLERRSKDAER